MVTKSRRIVRVGYIKCLEEIRNVYKNLVGKPEEERPFRKHSCRWKHSFKMDLREIKDGGCRIHSSGSGQASVSGSCKHGNEP
jgi:hypothetical protein